MKPLLSSYSACINCYVVETSAQYNTGKLLGGGQGRSGEWLHGGGKGLSGECGFMEEVKALVVSGASWRR